MAKTFYLNRPQEIQEKINSTFKQTSEKLKSTWYLHNGSKHYYTAELDEHKLLKSLINNEQQEYNILEIGSASGAWCEALKEYINNEPNIPENYKFNIIGLNGEWINPEAKSVIQIEGKCTISQLGCFKIENILEELEKLELNLEHKVDFIISNFTFRHLVDSVGTFLQIYEALLKPESGIMLTDGLFYKVLDQKEEVIYSLDLRDQSLAFSHLLSELKAQFITHTYDEGRSADHFIIKKPTIEVSTPLLEYLSIFGEELEKVSEGGRCNYITEFKSKNNIKAYIEYNVPEGVDIPDGEARFIDIYPDYKGFRGSKTPSGKGLFDNIFENFINTENKQYFYYADIILPVGEESSLGSCNEI